MKSVLRRVCFVLLCAAWAGIGSAQTIYVATNGTHDLGNSFNTWAGASTNINEAVALANSLVRNVQVSNGVYQLTNQLVVGAGITLQSLSGASNTFLRANGSTGAFRVMVISNASALVEGFTLTNGYSTGTHGGGIYMTTGTVRGCVVWGCATPGGGSYSGGGIYMTGGLLTNSTIRACTSGNAAGLWANGGSRVENCIIRDNVCTYTHSSYLTAPATIRNCRIFGNISGYHSGGISIDGGATIEGCLSYSNRVNTGGDGNDQNSVGGGITLWNGTAINCVTYSNDAKYGGGMGIIYGGRIVNCTIANNTARGGAGAGGGLYMRTGTVTNTIVYGNLRSGLVDNYGGTLSWAAYCCAPELTNSAAGNITTAPEFVNAAASDYHLQFYSPCVDTGTNLASVATDYDGATRPQVGNGFGQLRHDMGAYERTGSQGGLQVWLSGSPVLGQDPLQSIFTATVGGTNTTITWYGWDFTNSGAYDPAGSGLGVVTNTYGPGIWSVRLSVSNSAGESATVVRTNLITVGSTNIYVTPSGTPQFPYSSWATAATSLNDAASAALGPCTIWVTNGTYAVTNQIALSVGAILRSVNGTNVTSVYRHPSYTSRLIYMSHASAVVQGLTLSNGLSSTFGGGIYMTAGTVRDCFFTNCLSQGSGVNGNGGGVYMTGGLVTNVLILNCRTTGSSDPAGGGVYMSGGTMANSMIRGCTGGNAPGISAVGGTNDDCVIRDNASTYVDANYVGGATMRRCRFIGNSTGYWGGGLSFAGGLLQNCLIYSNLSSNGESGQSNAGGVRMSGGRMENCTIAHNQLTSPTSGGAGGLRHAGGAVTNTIIYGNKRATTDNNYLFVSGTIGYSCAPELSPGVSGNITGDPLFKYAATNNYRLQALSPCIDAGTNLVAITNDIEFAMRPQDGNGVGGAQWDMGAYEAVDASLGPLSVVFVGAPLKGLTSIDTVFTATPAGGDTNVVWYGWDWNSDGIFDRTGPNLGVVTQNFTVGLYTVSLLASNATEQAWATNVNYVKVSTPDMYVVTNGTPSFPYSSWATAATSIHDAVSAAVDGSTIHFTNGTHGVRYQVVLSDAITLRGDSGAANTILARTGVSTYGVLQMTHSNAVVEGLTIANGSTLAMGGAIEMQKGTVRNCIITNCVVSGGTGGGGIKMDSGLITNTLFANCTAANSSGGGLYMANGRIVNSTFRDCGGYQGAGFYTTGGTMEDCLITNCASGYIYANYAGGTTIRRCQFVRNTAGFWGGALCMSGGLLENCLVYSNSLTATSPIGSAQGGGVYNSGGRVVNCTVVKNKATGDGGGIYNNGGWVTNCVSWYNRSRYYYDANGVPNDVDGTTNTVVYTCAMTNLAHGVNGCTTNAPMFKNEALDDYHLSDASPCINAGTNIWSAGAIDLDGMPRIIGRRVEMGAYELALPGSIFRFR